MSKCTPNDPGHQDESLPPRDRESQADGVTFGRVLRDTGIARATNARPSLTRGIQHAAICLARKNGTVCTDELYVVVDIPEGSRNTVGGAILGLVTAKVLVRIRGEDVQSCRKSSHAREIKLFRLADSNNSDDWMARHPLLGIPQPPPTSGCVFTETSVTQQIQQRTLFGDDTKLVDGEIGGAE